MPQNNKEIPEMIIVALFWNSTVANRSIFDKYIYRKSLIIVWAVLLIAHIFLHNTIVMLQLLVGNFSVHHIDSYLQGPWFCRCKGSAVIILGVQQFKVHSFHNHFSGATFPCYIIMLTPSAISYCCSSPWLTVLYSEIQRSLIFLSMNIFPSRNPQCQCFMYVRTKVI